MKIAVPTNDKNGLDAIVSEHFGRCDTYTIIDEKGDIIKIIANTSSHNGGEGLPPELLKKNEVNILLCHGIGPSALTLCQKLSVQVYVNKGKTVKEIFHEWEIISHKEATLDDICEGHKL